MASEIYEILQAAGQEEAEQAEAAAASCKRKAHFFLGSNNKRAKTVVLHIDGLDDPVSVCCTDTQLYLLGHTKLLQESHFGAPGLLLSLAQCCQYNLAVRVWNRTGVEGSGCKCQRLNSRTLRLNLNAALQEACTEPDYITADRRPLVGCVAITAQKRTTLWQLETTRM